MAFNLENKASNAGVKFNASKTNALSFLVIIGVSLLIDSNFSGFLYLWLILRREWTEFDAMPTQLSNC